MYNNFSANPTFRRKKAQHLRQSALPHVASTVERLLRDIPGTGYEWHLVDSASRAPLVLVDSAYWMSRANRRADGGAGIKSWTFVSHQKGTATVTLVHVPPSAPATVGDTTRFRVVVE